MDSIILQTGDNTVTDGDVIGRLGFAASSETGTNARLVVAKIEAVAEEAFDASNNATEMVFYLAADGAAASKMTLTSAGNLNIGGELQTTNIGYTDGDNAIVIADGGSCTFPQDATFSGSIVAGTWQGTAIAHDYIGLDAIDGTNIADDAVNSEHYVDGSIDTAHIADLQVTTGKIAADAITGAKIADDAVDSEHYVDLSIDTAHIGNLQVTTGKIANLAVETGKINNLAVETGKINNLAVTTGKIADDAVTDAKLAHAITVVTSLTAPLIEGTTSIQTPLIEYTDGDDAIAIADGGGVTLSQAATFSKAVKTPLKSNSDGATVTFDLNEANTHTVTLGDNRTLAISNETAGQKFIINLVQDGTGSRTVTWFSTIKWAGGSAPTLTTTANKADSFGFLCTGTDAYYGFVIGQNI